jgi:uncharacterized protein (DUF433 family)
MDFTNYITIDKDVRFGKPTIIGTRITVADVLDWLADGMSTEEIIDNYPSLSKEKIQACLKYAATKEHNIAVA